MRLKKDHNSYRASGIIKRDFKHDESQPIRENFHKKKNTRRWCKGKVGIEHDYKKAIKWQIGNHKYYVSKCIHCGKERYLGKDGFDLSF